MHAYYSLKESISLNYDVEEFVPVSWFEPTKTHGKSLDLLHDSIIYLVFILLLLFLRR